MLREHPHIQLVLRWADQYRKGQLDIDGLQANLQGIVTALEGDVPSGVRQSISEAEEEVELLRFTVDGSKEADEVERVLRGLEKAISRYDDP